MGKESRGRKRHLCQPEEHVGVNCAPEGAVAKPAVTPPDRGGFGDGEVDPGRDGTSSSVRTAAASG
eukprot:CAMPEP_0195073628 /NCGR_PEP_ID=MMETSP0448-20130528/16912_1 /TAXON_ID=66468 /ORGANISM="Heterocapsa triquestra, Strain CCMP 448" /LENGTH=65 /DNA_ID=CAMNT_0040105757 /DNA_START=362 /DNA_END=555 /DNA_ORIENTATION=-